MNISFREVVVDDAKMLLDWRTSPAITQYMLTDVPYDLEAQNRWIVDSYSRKNYYHWVVLCDDTPIGFICIHNFDMKNAHSSWGFYKGASGFYGVGSGIAPFLYNWLFLHVGIRTIFTEVLYYNTKVVDWYLSYGQKFTPDKDRVIIKNGREILVVAMELSWENWDLEKYKDSSASFPTSHWCYSPV